MNYTAFLDIAAAVCDGRVVDWDSAARAADSDDDRRLLDELRFLATLAQSGIGPLLDTHRPHDGPAPPFDPARPDADVWSAAPPIPGEPAAIRDWGALRLLERVGTGSFGEVYRAWDTRLDREVALKILKRRGRGGQASSSTIVEEGRLLARVRHPNVVTVYGADRIDGEVGIWMEFVHGATLEHELRDRGVFGVDDTIAAGIQLAGALGAVHGAGLLHRDVKSQNVIRDRDGRLMLTDLGAGCDLEDAPDGSARDTAGTPLYLAPEVLAGGPATPQSDIYSLGVLLYHLATGSYPVTGRSLGEIRQAHSSGARRGLRDARSGLPDALVAIIERAIDPSPGRRYESADALGLALRNLAAEGGQAGQSQWVPARSSSRRRAALLGGLLLALAAVGVVSIWPRSQPPVIVVLPFENLGKAESAAFVDGLTDEIIRNLAQIDGLTVRSRTSSFAFRERPRNLAEVGRELGATHVLEGSVLWADGRLRVIPQFVQVEDDTPLWSDRFERDAQDVFLVQDEISRAIVNALRLQLGRGQRRYHTNVQAYELYLVAQELLHPHDVPGARKAAPIFEQVIAKDPAFAPAHAGLAEAWALMSMNYAGVSPGEGYSRMRPAAERALQLDPLLAEAHAAMGLVLARDREWARSEAAFRRAIELNGTLTSVRTNLAVWTLFPQGRPEDALRELSDALVADPLSLDVRKHMAWIQISTKQYADAVANARRVLSDEPNHAHTKQQLGRALLFQGQVADAIAIHESLGEGSSGFLGYAYGASGRRADAERLAAQHAAFPPRLVLIHAGLGNADRTVEALERMAARGDPRVGAYLTYPELAFMRGDPRLAALRRALGLRQERSRPADGR